jgi:hypothetical protein
MQNELLAEGFAEAGLDRGEEGVGHALLHFGPQRLDGPLESLPGCGRIQMQLTHEAPSRFVVSESGDVLALDPQVDVLREAMDQAKALG